MNRTGITSLIGSERPGYARGQYVKELKEDNVGGGIREYDKKRREFFRNPNIVIYSRTRLSDDNPYDYDIKEISPAEFDPKKVKDGTQLIVQYDAKTGDMIPGTGFDGSIGLEDAPFLFYSGPGDARRLLDQTDFDDMVYGKPFADDASFFDKTKERGKMIARGILGFAKNLPEMMIGTYRTLNPIDALGGIGPIDMFIPKSEEQKKQVEEMFEFPGYSNLMREKFGVEPLQTPSTFLDADQSLYKDTLVDDRMKAGYLQQKDLYDILQEYSDDELRAELESDGVSDEEIQEYFDIKNMTDKDLEDIKYFTDRDAIMQDTPGAFSSFAATIPVAVGPLGAVGQGANLISKGNRLSKMINTLRKTKKAKALDASVGLGVLPASIDLLEREVLPPVTVESTGNE